MMQAKRIFISLLVVVLLTFCSLTAFAAAEEASAFKVAVSAQCDTAIAEGDYAYSLEKDAVVKFSIASGDWKTSVYAIKLEIAYDANALELLPADNAEQVQDENVLDTSGIQISSKYNDVASVTGGAKEGMFSVNYLLRTTGYQGAGELVNFSFKVKDIHTNVGQEAAVTVHARVISGDGSYLDLPVEVDGAKFNFGVHTYGEEQARDLAPNDCTAGAEIFRFCTVEGCGKENVIARPNETGHDESGAEPNCTTAKICAREGCTYELLPKLGHAPNIEQATCMTDLYCTREDCPNKGEILEEKLPHDTTGPDATCTAAKTCKVCGTELAPMIPHDETGPEATCIAPKVCKYGCGKVLAPKLPHNTSGPDADCVNPKVCANEGCTAVLAEKLGHDVSGPAADCVTAKVCAREGCGVVLLAALGHDENGKPATCTTDKVCARPNCNFVIEERFGHDESGADATCALPKTCVTCGVVLVEKLDTPEAHVYGEWVVETEATMSSTGSRYKVCTLCEDKVTEEIPEKSSAWLIILIVVGVLVLVGGGVAVYFLSKNKKAKAESEETTEENSEENTEEVTEAPAKEATEEKTEE